MKSMGGIWKDIGRRGGDQLGGYRNGEESVS